MQAAHAVSRDHVASRVVGSAPGLNGTQIVEQVLLQCVTFCSVSGTLLAAKVTIAIVGVAIVVAVMPAGRVAREAPNWGVNDAGTRVSSDTSAGLAVTKSHCHS